MNEFHDDGGTNHFTTDIAAYPVKRLHRPDHRRSRSARPHGGSAHSDERVPHAFTTIQWTIFVYDLVLIGLIITMGRLGDLFGRRRFYSMGFLIFVAASAICGLSQSAGQLIFFRALQALGGSMIAANGRAIVSVNLPPEDRGRALGLTSTAFHIGFLTGPSWVVF